MARKERGIVVVDCVDSSVTGVNNSASITLISASNIYTKAVKIDDCSTFAVSAILTTSSLTPVLVSVWLEQSWKEPAVEGSFDATYVTTLSQSPTLISIGATATWFNYTPTVLALPYARFKLGCGAAMTAGAVKIQIKIIKQVEG